MLMKTRCFFHPPDEELALVLLCATWDSPICLSRWASMPARRCPFKLLVWEEAQAWKKVQWSNQIRSDRENANIPTHDKKAWWLCTEQANNMQKKRYFIKGMLPYLFFSYQDLGQGPQCPEYSNISKRCHIIDSCQVQSN